MRQTTQKQTPMYKQHTANVYLEYAILYTRKSDTWTKRDTHLRRTRIRSPPLATLGDSRFLRKRQLRTFNDDAPMISKPLFFDELFLAKIINIYWKKNNSNSWWHTMTIFYDVRMFGKRGYCMGRQCMESYFREVRQLILNNKGWVKNANRIFFIAIQFAPILIRRTLEFAIEFDCMRLMGWLDGYLNIVF